MDNELGLVLDDVVIFKGKEISFPMFETILDVYEFKQNEEFKELIFIKCVISIDKSIYLGYGIPKRTFIDCKFIIGKECHYIDGSMKMYGGQGITMIRSELFLDPEAEGFTLETMCINNLIINKTFNNKKLSFNKISGTFSFKDNYLNFKDFSLLDSNLSQDEVSGSGTKTKELYLNESTLIMRRSFICDKIVLRDVSGNLTTRHLINKTISNENEWMNDLEDAYIMKNVIID